MNVHHFRDSALSFLCGALEIARAATRMWREEQSSQLEAQIRDLPVY